MKNNKFSIIIPVYNTEEYLIKCLNSVFGQTYKNYEVIVVNDGSNGNCDEIVSNYDNIKYIKQKNGGLSFARNNGVKKATGDYVFFLDSDDYLDINILNKVNSIINNEDVIRIQCAMDFEGIITSYMESSFSNLSGVDAFNIICKCHFVEPATLYFYKREYWLDNKFMFETNRYHEDFGLIPEVILKARSVSSISDVGYFYYQRQNSIMNDKNYDKEKKRAYDILEQGINMIDRLKSTNLDTSIINSFIVNSIFVKMGCLINADKNDYLKIIRREKLINYILRDTIKRQLKYYYYKIKYKL